MTEEEMNSQLLKALRYPAIVYAQSYDGPDLDGKFTIDYPFDETPSNAIFFVAPCKGSITRSTDESDEAYETKKDGNILRLRKVSGYEFDAYGRQTPLFSYESYFIMCEEPNGNLREARHGDMVAKRLAILRIEVGVKKTIAGRSYNVAILCNSPIYGNALALAGLTVNNEAVFHLYQGKAPALVLNEDTGERTYLARADEMAKLESRIARLETRILYGTASPETALRDADEGTIYVKIQEE